MQTENKSYLQGCCGDRGNLGRPGLSDWRLGHAETKPGKRLAVLAVSRHHLTPHFCFLNSAILILHNHRHESQVLITTMGILYPRMQWWLGFSGSETGSVSGQLSLKEDVLSR